MALRTITLTLFMLVGLVPQYKAQYALDVGGQLGFANYLGEIGGGAGEARDWILDMKLEQTRWNPGAFIRYRLDYDWAVSGTVNYLRLAAADSISENPNRFTRNLSFRNDVVEVAGNVEYYFFNQPDVGRTGRYIIDFKAYLTAGLGFFYNNPKAQLNGEWIALQPLKTEGQENPYSKFQAVIPMGFGFYYTFARVHRFGLNFGYRLTFTDYIDDVSGTYADPETLDSPEAIALSNRTNEVIDNPLAQTLDDNGAPIYLSYVKGGIRGNPKTNDSYLNLSFTYSYVIRGNPKSFGKRKNYLYGRKRSRGGRARF